MMAFLNLHIYAIFINQFRIRIITISAGPMHRVLRRSCFGRHASSSSWLRAISGSHPKCPCHHFFGSASNCSSSGSPHPPERNALQHFIRDRIRATGPITVADYMKLCVSSQQGYYSKRKEIFGEHGDFVTSPELSQIFGELIGAWLLNELHMTGWTGQWQLVELGPGTGTLMVDILRVFRKLQSDSNLSVHFVEKSKQLIEKQQKLFGQKSVDSTQPTVPFHWHNAVEDIPDGFTVFVSNEFFDALPIHQFVRDAENGRIWHEVHVDLDAEGKFCFKLSPGETLCSQAFIPAHIREDLSRTKWEYCPTAKQICLEMVKRFTANGGFSLIIDYGHDGGRASHSLRAYRDHQQLADPLDSPGQVDLTADVDFGELARAVRAKCLCYGPVEQGRFLTELGLVKRMEYLLGKCQTWEQREAILRSCKMLVSAEQMGSRFKALSMFPSTLAELIEDRGGVPPGFASTLPQHPEKMPEKEGDEKNGK